MALPRPARADAGKKSAHAAEQSRPDVLKRREAWFDGQLDLDPATLVFIDETWASTNMARTRDRAPRGERLRAAVPHGHWKTTTFVAGLRQDGIVAPLVLNGPINRHSFETYVARVLVPDLRAGDVVVMDNLSSHKSPRVREMIEAAGATLRYLPPYSPDFNPIENAPRVKPEGKLSPSSRRSSAKPQSGPWVHSGTGLASASTRSRLPNAPTTSPPPATMQPERIPL